MPAMVTGDRCSWLAQGSDVQTFGKQGQSGKAGKVGGQGKNSDSLTLFLDGSPLKLDISGQKGVDGENGSNGSDGNCSGQPSNVTRNLPNLFGQFKPAAVGRGMPTIAVPPENLAVRMVSMGRRVIVVVTVARDV